MENTGSVLNKQVLLERFQGDEDFLKELFQVFLKQAPAKIDQVEAALKDRDYDLAKDLAHSLKGTAANIAAWDLEKAALKMEQSFRNEQLYKAEQMFRDLRVEFKKVVQALEEELAE